MKLPRDLSGSDLVKALKKLGYEETRQAGSHVRLTTKENGTHHITIPFHKPLKSERFLQYLGTWSGISTFRERNCLRSCFE